MNKRRGEIAIELGGQKYVLAPEFHGLAVAEEKAGMSLHDLSIKCQKKFPSVREIAALIYGGMVGAQGDKLKLTYEEVGQLVVKAGMNAAVSVASEFLVLALTGEVKVGSEVEPEEKKPEGEPKPESPATQ